MAKLPTLVSLNCQLVTLLDSYEKIVSMMDFLDQFDVRESLDYIMIMGRSSLKVEPEFLRVEMVS